MRRTKTKLPLEVFEFYGIETEREFRIEKRQELRRLIASLDRLRFACSFTPAYPQILEISKLVDTAMIALSIKNWGK